MKCTLTIALSLLVMHAFALTDTVAKTTFGCFQVNNTNYYVVGNCTPGSDVEFYSKIWGGSLLRTLTTDSTGSLQFTADTSFHPAFALNRTKRNANGKIGTGMVGYLQQIEFTLQAMAIANDGNNVNIYWQGQACSDALVTYELTKSKNGVTNTVATYKGNTASQYYMYTSDYEADATYSIRVVNTIKGLRYQAPLNTLETAQIKIYPTAVARSVNIVVPADNNTNAYRIADMQGRIVENGALHTGKNNIAVDRLVPGNYLVFTPNSTPVKIVKE